MYKIVAETLFTGKKVIYLPSCHSTNDVAVELIHSGEQVNGTVVIADYQTQGKGQQGNRWHSLPGQNLTLSVIWTPSFLAPSSAFALNMVVSLGVADVVQTCLPQASLWVKWANDVYVNNLKISGILIENILQGTAIRYSVVGIGLNVNQTEFKGLPATSLKAQAGREWSLPQVFNQLMVCLEKRYLQLQQQGYTSIKRDYLSRLYQLGQPAKYIDLRGEVPLQFEGIIKDVENAGRLVVQTAKGIALFDLKQIKFV
ncbi:MAG: biotin--[acetyl-CoA-carboxylase] ligase [Cytophagales bacterium]|nr:biotin--[acetyl-CoA-carboxylase] ligase [Bernardetiaceae bacterium]MDW8209755.1 biotin--[acetyl-CoA-carboxylase] ligase [Cytophagales bacterium]